MPQKKKQQTTKRAAARPNVPSNLKSRYKDMRFGELVKACNPENHNCYKCEHKALCDGLVLGGIPKPYQFKGLQNSILKKQITEII